MLSDLADQIADLGLTLPPGSLERLGAFADLLLLWNRRINLTAARSPADLIPHLIDSVAALPHLPPNGEGVDVGSGGGFPGIILAILSPLPLVLVEPTSKKTAFLATCCRELRLSHVRVERGRVEEVFPTQRAFQFATSRATWALGEWLPKSRSLLEPSGISIGFGATDLSGIPSETRIHPYRARHGTRSILTYVPRGT